MADLSVPPESPGALSCSASDLSPIRRVGSNESKDGEPSSPRRVQESKSMLWESKWPGGGVESITNLHSADEERWRCSQQATFVNWVNDRLKVGGKATKVGDLTVDLQDGTVLVRLMEGLTGNKVKGYNRTPRLTAHKMDNLDLVFSFMRSSGIKVVGIGSHNVYEGDLNRILGLIWTLIQKYQLRMEGTQVSTKVVMMDWLRALLPAWNISNLTTDWNDGRALIALINEVKPGIAPSVSTLDPTKRRINCNLALDIALNHLKIPKLISADNLSSSSIDELSIITYLSYFRDPARARLLKWVRRMLPQFNISNFLTDWMDGVVFTALLNKFHPGSLPEPQKEDATVETIKTLIDSVSKKFGITINFKAEKLATGEVDELQVMTLVMQIRDGKIKALPEEVVVSGPGITKAVLGKETHFDIDTTQGGPGQLNIQMTNEKDEKVDFSVKKRGRIITVSYCPHHPGDIVINIRWSGEHVPNSPFTVTATDALMVKFIDLDSHKRLVHVNEPVEISVNTEKSGQGTLSAHLMYDSEPPIPAEVEIHSRSVTKLRYVPSKPGQATLHVVWNGEEMSHLVITYTVVDHDSYQVASKSENRIYNVHEDIKFIIETKEGILSALRMTAILEGDDVQVPIKFETTDKGVGQATFHPTLPGTYRIEVACVDQLVQGSPFQVEVVDPSQCKMVEEIPNYIQLKVPYTIEVDTKQAGSGELTFECEGHQNDEAAFEADVSSPDSHGVSKIKITPLREGKRLATIKFQGTEIPGSPFRVFVCDPSRCQVSGEVLEKRFGMVGKPVRFKVTVDPIENLKPVIKATGPTAKYTPEVRETEKNVYTVQFTPWEVGTHEISVTYGDFHVPKSPMLVTITTFDSATCSATGSGLQKAFTGIPAQFVVLAKQEGLLKDSTLQIKVKGVVGRKECKVRARDNRNGSYNVAYLIHDPGAYLISIVIEDKPIPGSPFRLTALPGPIAEKCRMYGPILQPGAILTIGNPMDFAVDCSEGGTGELSVKAIGPGGVQARVYLAKNNKKGLHNVKLDPVRRGKYRISVRWSGRHIPGSPFMLSIYPGADASKCKAYGPGLEDGLVGKPSVFTIETKDAGAGTLKVRLHGVKDAFKIQIKPVDQQDTRTLQANYNPKKPGHYLVTIKWSEKHIPGSPFHVKIDGDDETDETDTPAMVIEQATPRDESLNPIAEEIEWEDDEEEIEDAPVASTPNPVPPKRKKRMKKWNKSPSSKTATSSAPALIHDGGIPTFDHTSMRTNYKKAFVGGGQPVVGRTSAGKNTKAMKNSRSSPAVKSASTSVLPQNKMITFSGLQQLQKQQMGYDHYAYGWPAGGYGAGFHRQPYGKTADRLRR